MEVLYQEIIVLVLIFFIICFFSVFFFERYRKLGVEEKPKGYLFLVEELFSSADDVIVKTLSKKYSFLATYFFFTFFYITGAGFISSATGLLNPFSEIHLTFSLALITFLMTFFVGIEAKK